jgi:two-component sensor histidine kinase/integral membrane sensor domain MASE1
VRSVPAAQFFKADGSLIETLSSARSTFRAPACRRPDLRATNRRFRVFRTVDKIAHAVCRMGEHMPQKVIQDVRERTRADATLTLIRAIGVALAVGIAYFLAAELSLALLAKSHGLTMFWLAGGVSSGALIALGRDARLPVVVGTMVATVIASLMGGGNIWAAATFALCNAGEALLTAWLIERNFGSSFSLDRLRNVLGLLATVVLGTAAGAFGGVVAYKLLDNQTVSIWIIWRHWFTSGSIGVITIAPLIIGLAEVLRVPPQRKELIEGIVALVTLAVITVFMVSLPREPWEPLASVALLFPISLWIAARCQPVFAAAAASIVSLTIVWTTSFGIGHLGDPALPMGERILSTQGAILGFTLCAYVLAALFAERRHAEAHRDLLIAELDHRVKNVLSRVTAVVIHTRQRNGTTDEFAQAIEGRIQSMAAAHALLSKSRWGGVGLTDLIRGQLAPYTTNTSVTIVGADIMLTSAETQTIAMVIHELVTNAVKYGALSSHDGNVSVSWHRTGTDVLTITWREVGGPAIVAPVQSGYGSRLIRKLVPYQLGGTVDLAFSPAGACCKIEIPLGERR